MQKLVWYGQGFSSCTALVHRLTRIAKQYIDRVKPSNPAHPAPCHGPLAWPSRKTLQTLHRLFMWMRCSRIAPVQFADEVNPDRREIDKLPTQTIGITGKTLITPVRSSTAPPIAKAEWV